MQNFYNIDNQINMILEKKSVKFFYNGCKEFLQFLSESVRTYTSNE